MQRLAPIDTNRLRQVDAAIVLEGGFDDGRYPFRHLGVTAAGGHAEALPCMGAVLAAAELLAQRGWELVTVTQLPGPNVVLTAVMRRAA